MEKKVVLLQKNHSIINSFPPDIKNFKLSKRCKMYEVTIRKNDYLLIPKGWFHWVFSEKDTLALTYSIMEIKSNTIENSLIRCIKDNIPYINKDTTYNLELEDIKKLIKNTYSDLMYGTDEKLCPVSKPNNQNNMLNEIELEINKINELEKCDKHSYIMVRPENFNLEVFKDIPNFNKIKNESFFDYKVWLWLSFDKKIDSGLHYDGYNNILYMLSGEKKVYLCNNYNYLFLYVTRLLEK